MELFAKCSCDTSQLNDRLNRVHNGIELQLFTGDICSKVEAALISDVRVVHAPLYKRSINNFDPNFNIDTISNQKAILYYMDIVNNIAMLQGRQLLFVVHVFQSFNALERNGQLYDLINLFNECANRFENLIFCIENTTEYVNDPFTSTKLAECIANPRVGTCLDICHAQILINISKSMESIGISKDYYVKHTLEDYFKHNMVHCNLIHLNKAAPTEHGFGEGKGHSAPYNPDNKEDMDLLQEVLTYYVKYGYECPCTIEVLEDDYDNAVNYTMTHNAVMSFNID